MKVLSAPAALSAGLVAGTLSRDGQGESPQDPVRQGRFESLAGFDANTRRAFREYRQFGNGEMEWCSRTVTQDTTGFTYDCLSKALQTLPHARAVGWQDMEVIRGEDGRPTMTLHGLAAELADLHGPFHVQVSLSHSARTAAAIVAIQSTQV